MLTEALPRRMPPQTQGSHKKVQSAFADAVEMQRVLKADVLDPKADRRERAQAALAWERLEERKRILRMKGLPKAVDVSKLPKHGRRSGPYTTAPIEPSEPKTGV